MNTLQYVRILLFMLMSSTIFLTICGDAFLQNISSNHRVDDKPSVQLKSWMSQAALYQNVTLNGDIVIENGTYPIEDMEFHLIGKITVRNDAVVIIRNAKLVLSPLGEVIYREGVVLRDRSKLIAENATIVFQPVYYDISEITVNDHALTNITNSKLSGWGYIIAKNSSQVYAQNTIMRRMDGTFDENCGVITRDNSIAHIQNSTLDAAAAFGDSTLLIQDSRLGGISWMRGLSALHNSTVKIKNSYIEIIHEISGNSSVNISSSSIQVVVAEGNSSVMIQGSAIYNWLQASSTSTVWLFDCFVERAHAYNNSTVWLINTSAQEISTFDNGFVLVGWYFPFFVLVVLPYTWVPFIQGSAFVLILMAIVFALILVHRKWASEKVETLVTDSQRVQVLTTRIWK